MDIFIIGYGTLLDRHSLGSTIGKQSSEEKKIVPVIVKDYKRLFNLRPDHYEPGNKLNIGPQEAAAMNLEPASGCKFNALGFLVTDEELQKLDKREAYYERHKMPLYSFITGEIVGEGLAYISKPDARWINRDITKLLPLWRDIVWARRGAYRISEQFGRSYDETTYLADGKTLMIDFYEQHGIDMSDPLNVSE